MASRPGGSVHREEEVTGAEGPPAPPALLFQLTDEQIAEISGFFVNCSVVYHFRAPPSSNADGGGDPSCNIAGGGVIVAREGVVKSASMSIHKSIVYQVERGGSTSCDDGQQPVVDTVAEDDISYATGCPVILKSNNEEKGEVEGKVLFAKPVRDGGAVSIMKYIVQWTTDAGLLRMEEGVTREWLSYNANAVEQRGSVSEDSLSNGSSGKGDVVPEGEPGSSPARTNDGRECAHHVVTPTDFDHSEGKSYGEGDPKGGEEEYEVYVSQLDAGELPETQSKSTEQGNEADTDISLAQQIESATDLSSRFESATHPLTLDSSRLDDRPDQHKKIKFEPPDSSLKRGAPAPSIESESPRKMSRTEGQPQDPWSYYGPSRTAESSGEDKPCKLIVPLWVLDAGERPSALFVHLVGHNDIPRGHKVRSKTGCDVHAKTGCEVHFSRYCNKRREPMTITITPSPYQSNEELQRNMNRAIGMVEESLFEFVQERNANDRLSYELRWGSPPHAMLPRSKSGAVQVGDCRWMQLLEVTDIPREWVSNSERNVQLRKDLRRKLWDGTGFPLVEVVVDGPQMQLKRCRPYVVVLGSEMEQVERATAMVTDAHGDVEIEPGELREETVDDAEWAL